MVKFFLILIFLCFAACALADALKVGDSLPSISGKTLTGVNLELPKDGSGKITLLISSFSKKGGADARQWAKQSSQEFAQNSNVISYSLIFLESVPRLFRGFVISGIKKGIPQEKHKEAILITKDEKIWKERIGVSNDDVTYLILLDRDGKILWMHSHEFNDEDFSHLKDQIQLATK
jgi:predicted transcriptional regulator